MRSTSYYNVKYLRSSDNASLYQSLHVKTLQNFFIVRHTKPHVLGKHTYSVLNTRSKLKKNTRWRDGAMGATRAACALNQKWRKRDNYNMGSHIWLHTLHDTSQKRLSSRDLLWVPYVMFLPPKDIKISSLSSLPLNIVWEMELSINSGISHSL